MSCSLTAGSADLFPGLAVAGPDAVLRMEKVPEQLASLGDARARTGEIGVGVDGESRGARHLGDRPRELYRAVEAVTTWSDEHHLRLRLDDLLPGNARGVSAFPAEWVLAAGDMNHLRHPVTSAEKRVGPFEEDDSPTPYARDAFPNRVQSLADVGDEPARALLPFGRAPDVLNVLLDVADRLGREPDDLGLLRKLLERPRELVA